MRPSGFYEEIAQQVLEIDADAAAYIELLKKGISLDMEFLRGVWPNYDGDLNTLQGIRNCVRSKDQTLTEDEISKVLEIVRTEFSARWRL